MLKYLYIVTLTTLITLIILGCANERAITGGPEDKEAPEVIFASPENESVEVSRKTEIVLRFSEQMKPGTFKGALQIWPRPPGGFEIKSSWTWLKVKFKGELDSNETYLLTLDKGALDLRGNGLSNTYVLAFSTGSKLNSGRIVGRIHGPDDIRKNGELFLFRQFDTALDQLRKQDPDYIFQPDDEGYYVLPYLAERSYMLFHHWDRNHNKLIDGGDYFGRPVSAAVSARSDSSVTPYPIWPRLIRPDRVKLLQAIPLGEGLIQLRVNRPVTPSSLEQIEVFSNATKIPILGSTNSSKDEFAMVFNTAIPLKQDDNIWLRNFKDSSGFSLHSDTIKFTIPAKLDTLKWDGTRISWFPAKNDLFPGDSMAVKLVSNLPLLITADSAFQIVDAAQDSVPLSGRMVKRSTMEWLFLPDTSLQFGSRYTWKLDTRFMRIALDPTAPDTLFTGKLTTVTPDSLGSIRILQMSRNILHGELLGKDVQRSFQIRQADPILLENLPARTYTLTAYIDANGDGAYNSGGLGPAAGAEPFWFYDGEIRVRARWETDLGLWRLP